MAKPPTGAVTVLFLHADGVAPEVGQMSVRP